MPRSLRDIVQRWRLRIWIGAFFFATILWLFVISEQKYTYVIEVPIRARNIKAGKIVSGEIPYSRVRFRGTGRSIFKAIVLKSIDPWKGHFRLVLDLERISTEYDFFLNEYYDEYPQKVEVPRGFELEFVEVVSPDTVHIDLDDYMVKPVSVVAKVLVRAAPGFTQVGPIIVSPENIELRGPKESIRFVDTVETEYREFLDRETPLRASLPLNLDFPAVVEASSPEIQVTADIQSIGERIITEVPVKVLNKPDGIRVFPNPSTVSLTITGGVEYIAALSPSDIEVYVDYASRQKQEIYHEPTVRVPADVIEWSDLSPKNVELAIANIRE